ncbi:E3 ubiquitin-protein ligase RNF138 [Microcaecilia unicolor]|uniref:E3 ubiquitin-protein ligase RNF138 n=1 Tax=Microcaecilia unicolor TaxID=1415580 RepID=A0A6P7YR73_9AMPH|nr:E3 ubiquitin-protein ligase RNF138-like [Microcaecilia unicolor]XP_030069754.1 E3 ubiquitin-protein ligase RNF138-like [Microcaecilia unicolor]XP_030069764.1 E3 ubiquitin-protein ligase RNF138-like [Microcaecilia unicolor]
MAAASSVFRASPLDEEFYCSICRDVFTAPVRTTCKHVFCRKCFMTAMKTSGPHCPMCRGQISKMERCTPQRATDVQNDMRKFSGNCKCCGKQVQFSQMTLHYRSCYDYQKEYCCEPQNPNPSYFPLLTSNRDPPTYQCPMCDERDYHRRGLVEHVNRRHSTEIVAKVCPICASLPGGDPTYVCSNVVGHLNARHKFLFDTMSPPLDEDMQYLIAILESYEDGI